MIFQSSIHYRACSQTVTLLVRGLLRGHHSPHAGRLAARQQQEREHTKQHGDACTCVSRAGGALIIEQSIDQSNRFSPKPLTQSPTLSRPPHSCLPHERCREGACRAGRGAQRRAKPVKRGWRWGRVQPDSTVAGFNTRRPAVIT